MIEWKDSVWVTLYTQEGDSNLHLDSFLEIYILKIQPISKLMITFTSWQSFHQFHQPFGCVFFVQNFGAKKHTAKRNYRKAAKKLPKRLTYEKVVLKTLMELTPSSRFLLRLETRISLITISFNKSCNCH